MDSASILGGIASLFILIALNAFFVLAEYSLAVSRRTRISELAEQGSSRARLVQRLMLEPNRFFASTQIGVTLTSIAIGVFSEPAFSALFGSLFSGVPFLSSWWKSFSVIISGLLGLFVATYFQIVLAELVPRGIVLQSAERIALLVVPPMDALARIFTPFIWLLKTSSSLVLRGLGFSKSAEDRPHSIAELKMLVDASERGGVLESDQREMLNAIFTFGDTTVREVMVPRMEMICIDADTPVAEVIAQLSENPLSRLPVYEESIDQIIGVLHTKDLIRVASPNAPVLTVRGLVRRAFFVPDTQRADEMLQQFRAKREHMAIVLDEYGGTAGLVTLYDLVSEIVGEVEDAAVARRPDIQPAPDGTTILNGFTSINDVNESLGLNLVDANYDTIAGYVMGQLGRVPQLGDELNLPEYGIVFRVEEMDKLRIARVRLKRIIA